MNPFCVEMFCRGAMEESDGMAETIARRLRDPVTGERAGGLYGAGTPVYQ